MALIQSVNGENIVDKILETQNISKQFGDVKVVDNVSFILAKGQVACLLGPSGSGKTTLLRLVAGFETPDSGKLILHGQTVSEEGRSVPPEKRRIGMVFQDYALFPHLTVRGNVGFGLRDMSRKVKGEKVQALIEKVGLKQFENNYPHELSGGQQQRVALARALVMEPQIILLDEPFSNLDVTLRENLSREVRQIIKDLGLTALMVTHNQQEAFAVADEIGVVMNGRILQWGTAHELYHKPANREVAEFVGEGVLLEGSVVDDIGVKTSLGLIESPADMGLEEGTLVDVLVRPEDLIHDDKSEGMATIMQKDYRGPNILFTLRTASGEKVLSLVPSHHNHNVGEKLGIRVEMEDFVIFPKNDRQAAA